MFSLKKIPMISLGLAQSADAIRMQKRKPHNFVEKLRTSVANQRRIPMEEAKLEQVRSKPIQDIDEEVKSQMRKLAAKLDRAQQTRALQEQINRRMAQLQEQATGYPADESMNMGN